MPLDRSSRTPGTRRGASRTAGGPFAVLRRAIIVAMLLATALCATPASADEMRLAWGGCENHGGALDYVLTCATPIPPPSLYLSFVIDQPVEDVVAIDYRFVIHADAAALPPFWQFATSFDPGLCNGGMYVYGGTSDACSGLPSAFPAPAAGVGYVVSLDPAIGVLVGSVTVQPADAVDLAPGEYFAAVMKLDLSWAAETGGGCVGCSSPVRLGEHEISGPFKVSPRVSLGRLSGPAVNIEDELCVTANGGGGLSCAPTPAVPSTWGRLKSLYR